MRPTESHILVVQIDTFKPLSSRDLAVAVFRAIDYTLDNDIADTEILNRDLCGQISVSVLKTVSV